MAVSGKTIPQRCDYTS